MSSNNSASATVVIPVSTNLSISKTNTLSSVVSGSCTVYGIIASNNGPNAADGAIVADPAVTGLVGKHQCELLGQRGRKLPASPSIVDRVRRRTGGNNVFPASWRTLVTCVTSRPAGSRATGAPGLINR